MALAHSPSIVTNGLVFAYDMANTQKSWKGKPSTNYIKATPTWAGDGVNQSSFTKGSVEITNPIFMYYGLKTFLWSPGASLNCYLQSDDIVGGTATTSATWTFSCYVKAEDSRPITALNVYMYFPTGDGASTGTITDAGNGWYRISRTRTGTESYIALAGFTGFVANIRYYLSGAMLTKDDMTVGPLAGDTTRSTANNIVDLTGRSTATAGSLTYNSDNTFNFDYTGPGYISVPLATAFNKTEGTMNFWLYPTRYNGGNGYFVNREDATANAVDWFWIGPYSGSFYFRIGNGVDCCSNDLAFTNFYTLVPLNTWVNMCFTWKANGTSTIYKNGVLYTSRAIGNIPATNPAANGRFGLGHANADSYYNGKMPVAQIYNRQFTDAEVLSNFNALRGRYGI